MIQDSSVRKADSEKYVLKDPIDFVILSKIYELEAKNLTETDKIFITLIRTQLEHDWRTPLLSFLDELLKKYKDVNSTPKTKS